MEIVTRFVLAGLLLLGIAVASPGVLATTASERAVPYASCFERSAAKHQLSPVLLKAVAATESDYNPNARSHANAHGLMQIQWPGTAKHLGVRRLAELYSPCKNIELGARYLRELHDRYDNNERRALAAYNYGPGRIKAKGAMPHGALRYIATVQRHRTALSSRGLALQVKPSSVKKNHENQRIAEFSSKARAARYLTLLRKKIPSSRFELAPGHFGRHAVVLTSSSRVLSADARTLLKSLGWSEL